MVGGGGITVNFEFQFAYIEIFYRRLKKRCAHDGVSGYLDQEHFDLASGLKPGDSYSGGIIGKY